MNDVSDLGKHFNYISLTIDLFRFCRENCVSIEIIPDVYSPSEYIVCMTSRKNLDRLTGMRYETQQVIDMHDITYARLLTVLEGMVKQLDDFMERKNSNNAEN